MDPFGLPLGSFWSLLATLGLHLGSLGSPLRPIWPLWVNFGRPQSQQATKNTIFFDFHATFTSFACFCYVFRYVDTLFRSFSGSWRTWSRLRRRRSQRPHEMQCSVSKLWVSLGGCLQHLHFLSIFNALPVPILRQVWGPWGPRVPPGSPGAQI